MILIDIVLDVLAGFLGGKYGVLRGFALILLLMIVGFAAWILIGSYVNGNGI